MPPQFENNNVPPTNLENHHRDPSILIILIVVMLLSGAGAVWYISNLPPEPTPQPITKVDQFSDTTDWQTYRNEEYGFEIKYPEYLLLDEVNVNSKTNYYNDYVSIDIDTPEKIAESKKPNPGSGRNIPFFRFGAFNPIDKEEVISCPTILKQFDIAGISVNVCEYENMGGPLMTADFIKNNISFSAQSQSYFGENIKLIDQILSTFKFISTSTPLSTSTSTPAR